MLIQSAHPYHPQSNGRDERIQRTFRKEPPLDKSALLYQVRSVIAEHRTYFNDRRPHSALYYLCPRVYYRGYPLACLAEREAKPQAVAAARRAYWQQHPAQQARRLR